MNFTKKANEADKWGNSMTGHLEELDSLERKERFQKSILFLLPIILICCIAFWTILKDGTTGNIKLTSGKIGNNYTNQSPKSHQSNGELVDVELQEFINETKTVIKPIGDPVKETKTNQPKSPRKIQKSIIKRKISNQKITFELTP